MAKQAKSYRPVQMDADLHDKIKDEAEKSNMKIGAFIKQCFEKSLDYDEIMEQQKEKEQQKNKK